MKRDTSASVSGAPQPPAPSDDPAMVAAQAREALAKNAAEIRKQRVAIATEPPTLFRP